VNQPPTATQPPQANCTSEGADTVAVGGAFVALWRYFQTHDWDITWLDPQVGFG
jgi:hypothetical protein